MQRNSFVFYRSFYEALRDLPADDKAKIYEAIIAYGLDGVIPKIEGYLLPLFTLIKPQIDANNRKFENGKLGASHGAKGGRPPKNKPQNNPTETPQKPQNNPTETPNVNVNVNVNDNVNVVKGDFEKVFAEGIKFFPALQMKDPSFISMWISQGCDVEKDILPTIRRLADRTIGSWKFFNEPIAQAKANREAPLPEVKVQLTPEEAKRLKEKELRRKYVGIK